MNILVFTTIYILISSIPAKNPLRFSNSQFNILQLTDMHFGEDPDLDQLSIWFIEEFLLLVRPQLTVLTGDMVTGDIYKEKPIPKYFENIWQHYTKPFEYLNFSFASILGNHDAVADLNRREIMELDMTHPKSYSQISPPNLPGASNYFIDIFSSIQPEKIAVRLWMFDSGEKGCGGIDIGYGCVEKEVVNWYNDESAKFRDIHGEGPLHLAFVHIPLPEYLELVDNHMIAGKKEEYIECPNFNTGLFDAFLANQNVKAIFCGHDHVNDFQGILNGIELVYGRKSAFGSYGPTWFIETKRGARVINIKESTNELGELKVSYEHYVLNEDGEEEFRTLEKYHFGEKQYYCGNFLVHIRRYIWLIVLGIVLLCFSRRIMRKLRIICFQEKYSLIRGKYDLKPTILNETDQR